VPLTLATASSAARAGGRLRLRACLLPFAFAQYRRCSALFWHGTPAARQAVNLRRLRCFQGMAAHALLRGVALFFCASVPFSSRFAFLPLKAHLLRMRVLVWCAHYYARCACCAPGGIVVTRAVRRVLAVPQLRRARRADEGILSGQQTAAADFQATGNTMARPSWRARPAPCRDSRLAASLHPFTYLGVAPCFGIACSLPVWRISLHLYRMAPGPALPHSPLCGGACCSWAFRHSLRAMGGLLNTLPAACLSVCGTFQLLKHCAPVHSLLALRTVWRCGAHAGRGCALLRLPARRLLRSFYLGCAASCRLARPSFSGRFSLPFPARMPLCFGWAGRLCGRRDFWASAAALARGAEHLCLPTNSGKRGSADARRLHWSSSRWRRLALWERRCDGAVYLSLSCACLLP